MQLFESYLTCIRKRWVITILSFVLPALMGLTACSCLIRALLWGTVIDSNGLPISGAIVTISGAGCCDGDSYAGTQTCSYETDWAGRWANRLYLSGQVDCSISITKSPYQIRSDTVSISPPPGKSCGDHFDVKLEHTLSL